MRMDRPRLSVREQLPLYVFVSALFAAGAVFGVLMYHGLTLEQQQNLAGEVLRYLRTMQAGAAGGESPGFAERAIFFGKWLLLVWLLGVTVVGVPLIFALDFLKGVLVGFSAAALAGGGATAWKGILLTVVSLAPSNVIVVPALLMASVSGVSFAVYVTRNRLVRRYGRLKPVLLAHSALSAVLLLAMLGAAFVEIYVSPLIVGWAAPYVGA